MLLRLMLWQMPNDTLGLNATDTDTDTNSRQHQHQHQHNQTASSRNDFIQHLAMSPPRNKFLLSAYSTTPTHLYHV